MTKNNSYDKFNAVIKQRLNDVDVNLECSINLETTEPVSKILAVNVEAGVDQIESLTSEASVNGNVIVSLVYLTEQGLVCNANYTSPFISKVIDKRINPNSKVFLKVCQSDAKVQSLINNVAKVDCYLLLKGFVVNNEEINYLSAVDSDVCTLNEYTNYYSLVGVTNSSWIENLEIQSKENIKQVISSCCNVIVKNVEPDNSFVTVTCEVVNKLMYLTDEDKIKTAYTKNEIKQDIECEYSTKECKIEFDIKIKSNNVKNNIENNEDELKISIEIPLDVCIRVYSINNIELISDLFSTKNFTNTTISSYENSIICEPIYFEKKIEGSLTLSNDEPRIDKLLAVNYSKVIVTNEFLENGQYTVSGVVSSNLIYFNEDDQIINSIDVEFPFIVNTQTEYEGEYLTDLDIQIEDVDVMVKRGKDVYVDALLKVRTKVCRTESGVVMSDVEYTDALPLKDCAIEIYFAKSGEKVWDIAKKLFVTPETIYLQNPNVSEVLEKDEKLAIYYKLLNPETNNS